MEILSQNLVIIGDFNPAIIQPRWIISQKIYQGKIGLDLNLTNQSIRYFMEKSGIYWEIIGKQFVVYNRNPLEKLDRINLGFVRGIFEKLNYTPIQAIGHNIHFKIPENENIKSIFRSIKLKDENLISYNFVNKFKYKDKTCTVQIEQGNNEFIVKFNFEKKIDSSSVSKEINGFIDSLGDFYKYGNSFIKSI